ECEPDGDPDLRGARRVLAEPHALVDQRRRRLGRRSGRVAAPPVVGVPPRPDGNPRRPRRHPRRRLLLTPPTQLPSATCVVEGRSTTLNDARSVVGGGYSAASPSPCAW